MANNKPKTKTTAQIINDSMRKKYKQFNMIVRIEKADIFKRLIAERGDTVNGLFNKWIDEYIKLYPEND